MKKTTKKLSINKETVASFETLSMSDMKNAKGGEEASKSIGDILTFFSLCFKCYTIDPTDY